MSLTKKYIHFKKHYPMTLLFVSVLALLCTSSFFVFLLHDTDSLKLQLASQKDHVTVTLSIDIFANLVLRLGFLIVSIVLFINVFLLLSSIAFRRDLVAPTPNINDGAQDDETYDENQK